MSANQNLSRAEIDELSQALGAAEAENPRAGRVRSYDFEHPDKLSRQNLRALQLIFSGIERPWAMEFSKALKTDVVVRANSPEQLTFSAHAEFIPEACVIAAFTMSPLRGIALIDMSTELGMRTVSCLTGGKGENIDQSRPLTLIELNILKRLLNRLCAELSLIWKPVLPMEFSISEFYQSVGQAERNPNERMISVGVTLHIGSQEHRMSIGIPLSALDSVLGSLDPQLWMQEKKTADTAASDTVADLLDPVCLDMAVELGRAQVSMQGLMNMEIGDVIRLDRMVKDPLEIKIGNRVKLRGKAGLVGKRISVEIE